MSVNKSIKKLIVGLLLVIVSTQTMLFSSSFSSIQNNASQFVSTVKKTIKKHKAVVAIAVGSCMATYACALGFKNKKTTIKVALGGFIATSLIKIYCSWKEARRRIQEKENLSALDKEEKDKLTVSTGKKRKKQEEKEQDETIVEENLRKREKEAEEQLARDLEESLSQMEQTLEVMRKIEQLERANKKTNGPLLYRKKEASTLGESFYQVNPSAISAQYSLLTYSYVHALCNLSSGISLEEVITQFNSYSPQEREKLAKIISHEIGVEPAEVIRALEFIESGYANLTHILQERIDAVPGYNRVAYMSDEECAELQSDTKTKEKEKIRQDYLSSIISVVWTLYDYALQRGDAFTQGTFNIHSKKLQDFFFRYIIFANPDYNTLGWFSGNGSHPYAYRRISSHLSDFSEWFKQETGNDIPHYGIDIRFGEKEAACNFLPNNMTHILFIPYNSENNKFILKPEDYCMYNVGEIAQHATGWVRSRGESLFGSADREKHQRKERIPKEIITNFNKLIDELSATTNEQKKKYKQQARALGIQGIVSLKNEFVIDSSIYQFIDKLEKRQHSENSFGQEVFLSEEEILKFLPITNMNKFKKDKGAVFKKKLSFLLHNFYFLKKRVFDKLVQKSSLELAE